jgi:hypothetical protein
MSLLELPIAASSPATRVAWSRVDDGFWVANHGGAFFGSIDAVSGGFVARDGHGSPIGLYDTLDAAKASLLTTTHPENLRRRRRFDRMTLTAATLAGAVTVALALTAGAVAPYL